MPALVLTAAQLQRVCRISSVRTARLLPHLNASLPEAEVITPVRLAMYLAQLGHESADFQFFAEIWGSTPAQLRYEGRADLGNTQPGDGYRFRGRGAIQVTGRRNYSAAALALGLPLIEQPDLAAQPENAFRISAWFWRTHSLNVFADKEDVDGATRRINGGLNGRDDRLRRYDLARDALGIAIPRA